MFRIEVIGAFLWVSGNTKPYKEELKSFKYEMEQQQKVLAVFSPRWI